MKFEEKIKEILARIDGQEFPVERISLLEYADWQKWGLSEEESRDQKDANAALAKILRKRGIRVDVSKATWGQYTQWLIANRLTDHPDNRAHFAGELNKPKKPYRLGIKMGGNPQGPGVLAWAAFELGTERVTKFTGEKNAEI